MTRQDEAGNRYRRSTVLRWQRDPERDWARARHLAVEPFRGVRKFGDRHGPEQRRRVGRSRFVFPCPAAERTSERGIRHEASTRAAGRKPGGSGLGSGDGPPGSHALRTAARKPTHSRLDGGGRRKRTDGRSTSRRTTLGRRVRGHPPVQPVSDPLGVLDFLPSIGER